MLAALAAACASPITEPVRSAGAQRVKIGNPYKIRGQWYYPADERDYRERGTASWYGPNFHGKPTANGERFNQNDLTAAHRTLPMPSWVRVENLENGREVTLRINDRGPFAAGRIIDVSHRAAQLLDMERAGVARVLVTRVYPNGEAPPVRMAAHRSPVLIQVAAFAEPQRTEEYVRRLAGFGAVSVAVGPDGLSRVRLGPYAGAVEAQSALAKLRRAGYVDAHMVTAPAS